MIRPMDALPVFFDLRGRDVLVVGGGAVAERKIDLLLRAGARVTVVAPGLSAALTARRDRGEVEHLARAFQESDVAGRALVVAAADDAAVNAAASRAAQAAGVPVNVVDAPELCTVTFGSIVEREPITVAISSGGRAPVLARLLKARLEHELPAAFGRLAALAGKYRARVKARLPESGVRRAFWEWVMHGPVAEAVFAGREAEAEALLEARLADPAAAPRRGCVYLVGAGPGDPDLMTFRALRILQKADIIFYDRLIPKAVLDLARRDAERFYVGKERSHHCVPQSQINALLIEHARAGRTVVRLKGGDPFIFGRGGEEALALAEAGVDFQVVPGITAASGCAAYAGIPLTHRDLARGVRFLTGHTRDGRVDLDLIGRPHPQETLVFYMALSQLEVICRALVERGLPGDWPAAAIEQGTTARQRVVEATLDTLPAGVQAAGLRSPALLIVGRVVRLRARLGWFLDEAEGGTGPVYGHGAG